MHRPMHVAIPEKPLGSERSSQVKATHGRTQRDPPRCKSIEQERKKERSIKHYVAMLMPFPSEEPLRPRTNPRKTFGSAASGPRMELGSRSGARAEPERSANGAQDPERSTGLRKNARGPETTLFRDRGVSRHFWESQCSSSPSNSY